MLALEDFYGLQGRGTECAIHWQVAAVIGIEFGLHLAHATTVIPFRQGRAVIQARWGGCAAGGRPDRVRPVQQVVRGGQQHPGRDHCAQHGDEPAGRGAHDKSPASAAVRAPPLVQRPRQGSAPRGPAIARRRSHAQGREQEQPGQQRPARLSGGFAQRPRNAGRAEQGQRGFGPVCPQRLPPLSVLAGFRGAQEGRFAREQAKHRGPRHRQGRWTAR